MTANVSEEDEGKTVIDANGERVGTVHAVDDGAALVDPVTEVDPMLPRILGWIDDPGVMRVSEQSIETITESQVRLRSNL